MNMTHLSEITITKYTTYCKLFTTHCLLLVHANILPEYTLQRTLKYTWCPPHQYILHTTYKRIYLNLLAVKETVRYQMIWDQNEGPSLEWHTSLTFSMLVVFSMYSEQLSGLLRLAESSHNATDSSFWFQVWKINPDMFLMSFKNILKPQTTISDFQASLPYLCSASLSPGRGGLGGATSSSDMSVKLSVGVTMGVVLLRIAFSRSVRGFSHTLRKTEALLKCLYAKLINPYRPLRLYLSVLVTGGAGLLGDVGDGCSCFSIVSFTSSCYKRTHSGYKYASVVLTLSQTHISSHPLTFTPSSTALITVVTVVTVSLSSRSMPSSITWSDQRMRFAKLW